MAVIAGWKIDRVSEIMTRNKFSKLIEEKKKEITTYIEDRLRSNVFSKEVLETFDANPGRMKVHTHVNVRGANNNSLFSAYTERVPLPVTEEEKMLDELWENKLRNIPPIKYELMVTELADLKKKEKEFKGKCKCVLASLKTYNKIKKDFPEAYEVLVVEVDKETLPSKDTCTDVEELRATLNS